MSFGAWKLPPAAFAEATGTTLQQAERRISRYERTFRSMEPWLPRGDVRDFLDIGCGTGGIAILVAQHYPGARVNLIDGCSTGEKYTYRPDGRPWGNVSVALSLFEKYFQGRAVLAWPPDPSHTIPCELIWSNCSWGHHYAIETYLGLARRSLKLGGTLIVDLRLGEVGKRGRNALRTCFEYVADIDVGIGKKYARTVWGCAS